MSKKHKIKKTSGIRHYEDADVAQLEEGTELETSEMLDKTKAKIRITTLIDVDILDELKRLSSLHGDGRYQTFLNQLLRQTLFFGFDIEKIKIAEIIHELVKPEALRHKKLF